MENSSMIELLYNIWGRRQLVIKPYCETVDEGVQIAVEHMFGIVDWGVCLRNNE